MKIGKRILSIVLALVMLSTMVTSVFYASAKEENVKSVDAGTVSLETLIDELLGEYSNGDKLVEFVDNMVKATIEGKIIYDEDNRQIITGLDESITAGGDAAIDQAYTKYISAGDDVVALGDKTLMDLLNTQKVFDVPIMQLRYVQNLDVLVKNMVLADGSDVMQSAANALQALFPNVEPTYESIVSCLIPILSAFNFGEIMANMDNITGALQLASPVAFAYLAGIDSDLLKENYLSEINANLAANGYSGTEVAPLITLSAEQQTALLEYVAMEKGGNSLGDIAQAGFKWTDFAGDANRLDLANAFLKIALGDPDKLGAIAASEAGPALVNLLCDFLNDIQDAPVSVILAKLSNAKELSKIVDFAMSLLNGFDADFKSYELFNNNIFVDGEGNTTFYDKLIKEDPAEYEYIGPKAMDQYLPVIAAALDFLNNIKGVIDENDGDLIKTLFVDKLPQLGNIVRAAISYEDGGEQKVGVIAYFINEYKTYLQAINASLSDDVLISIAQAAIAEANTHIEAANVKIATWQSYLEQVNGKASAAKLAKAQELGLLDETATVYDAAAVQTAIEAKCDTLRAEIEALQPVIEQAEQAVTAAQQDAVAAQDAYDALASFEDFVYGEPFYAELGAIFDEGDLSLIDTLRTDCAEDFDAILGAGKFEELAGIIADNLENYVGDVDTFIDDCIFSDGVGYYDILDQVSAENDQAQAALENAESALDQAQASAEQKAEELAAYENGSVLEEIEAAGDGETIYISDTSINAEGEFTVSIIEEAIITIENEEISGYEKTIAAEEEKIEAYSADKDEQEAFVDAYDTDGLIAQQSAFEGLANALMVFLGGDESTKSLYDYFNDGQPIEMLLAPDRVAALRTIIDGAIPLVAGFVKLSEENVARVWAIEALLFGENGILSTFYSDFIEEPVTSVVSRIAPLAAVAENIADMGFFEEIVEQYRPLIGVVGDLFGDDSYGFIAQWKTPYADGSAGHHYINAVLSLVPKIVDIYDQAKEIEQIAAFVEPYSDIIELGLNFLTKDFYDDIMDDGFIKTILDKDLWKTICDFAAKQVRESDLEQKDLIASFIDAFYTQILETFYTDLKANPSQALSMRATVVSNILQLVASFVEDFNISEYESVVSTKMFKGFIDMIPEEYRDLIPGNIVAIFTLFVRTIMFGEQAIIQEDEETNVTAGKYFYFTPKCDGEYAFSFVPQGAQMDTVYFDGEDVALEQKDGAAVVSLVLTAGQTYELCINTQDVTAATVYAHSLHEHVYEYEVTTPAGCESIGEKVGTCSVCGATVTEQIPALGHDFGEWAQSKAPTCTEKGEETRVCSRDASHIETREVAALGHDFGEWTQTKAPTCTEAGEESRVCSRDASHIETRAIEASGHDFGPWTQTKAPTCTEAGEATRVCTKDASHVETKAIPALGHDWEDTKVNATATKVGYTEHVCKNCGIKTVDSYTAPTGKLTLKCQTRTANAEALIWNKVAGVNGYQIQISNATGAAWATAKVTAANAYTFKGLTAGGNYKFRVRFYITAGGKNYFSPWATITSPTLPSATALTKLVAGSRSFTAQWKKQAVTGYQLQYATNAKFTGGKTVLVKNAKTLKTIVKGLGAKRIYYVRIRTFKTISKVNYFSTWSKALKVKTK